VISEAFATRLMATDPEIKAADFRRQPGVGMRYEPKHAGGQLSLWHRRLGRFFDIGTLYTMLAGMLNLLVVYDAWAGPMRAVERDDEHAKTGSEPQRGTGG